MQCDCETSWLTRYVLVYVVDPSIYVNHDHVRTYGVIVDDANRTHPLLRNHRSVRSRVIWAYTIAEAFRLVEFEAGVLKRRPVHQVLDEDKEVILTCTKYAKTELLADLNKAALERFLAS